MSLLQTVDRLCELSRRAHVEPWSRLAWPDALGDEWTFSPELVSLAGTDAAAALDEPALRRLAFFETINFFSLNIAGERALMEGLARRLYARETAPLSPYIHHFLEEENHHMHYFGTFCLKYANKVYPEKKLPLSRPYAPGEEDFLFFARVMIFEEIVDTYNVRMAKDERLAPIAQQINLLHHLDETRHLAFGRLVVKELWDQWSPQWSAELIANLRAYLSFYLRATWREYYNPDVYRDAGLPDPYALQEQAFDHPHQREHRRRLSDKCVRHLRDCEILLEEPTT